MTSHPMICLRGGLTSIVVLLMAARPATALQVTVSMNQTQYYPGDPMEITLTAYNSEPTDVTLQFPRSCQVFYQMGPYQAPEACFMMITYATVPVFGTKPGPCITGGKATTPGQACTCSPPGSMATRSGELCSSR